MLRELKEYFVHRQTIQDVRLQEDDILVAIGPMHASAMHRQDLQAVESQPGKTPQ